MEIIQNAGNCPTNRNDLGIQEVAYNNHLQSLLEKNINYKESQYRNL